MYIFIIMKDVFVYDNVVTNKGELAYIFFC